MANAAPAVDANGDIYVVTGNGPYNPQFGADQLGESVVRLTWNPGDPGSLWVSDWFTPFLDADRDHAHKDQDLAAGGVVALPDDAGLIVGGKDGVYYHVNRADMGERDFSKLIDDPFVATFEYQPWNGHASLFDDLNQVTSTDPFTIGRVDRGRTPHIHGTGVYFDDMLFVHGENNAIYAFSKTGGHFSADPVARGTATASSRDRIAGRHAGRHPLAVGERHIECHPVVERGVRQPAERSRRQHRPDPEHPARVRGLDGRHGLAAADLGQRSGAGRPGRRRDQVRAAADRRRQGVHGDL